MREADRPEWLRMRQLLWPECSEELHAAEMNACLRGEAGIVFVAERPGGLCGFAEAALRREAEGCGAGPIGYLEGWYVDADTRRRDVGRQLVLAVEQWARGRGCAEMASDAEVENRVSRAAHAALGYQEVIRLAHFRKTLDRGNQVASGHVLHVLRGAFAVCRLGPGEPVPTWLGEGLFSITRTADELSIVCRDDVVPEGLRTERGWRCLRVAGKLDFSLVGVLASLLVPLAQAGVSVFALSTFDTDYVLVRAADVQRSIGALRGAGHTVVDDA